MKITILAVGKLKEKYWTEAMGEYVKRLTPFAKVEVKEVPEQRTVEEETQRLMGALPEHAYVMLLDTQGKEISSSQLAEKFDKLTVEGVSHLCFVIGGAFGFTDDLRKRADFRWCFSPLTFTHQMIRVILAEQIYRAFKISRGEKYHW